MPMSIDYIEGGGIITRGDGLITGSEIKEINDLIYESPDKIKKIHIKFVTLQTFRIFLLLSPS